MNNHNELNDLVIYYKKELSNDRMQKAYIFLVKYVRQLKSTYLKKYPEYKFGNISQGYMDYTYFPIFNDYLRKHLLRFGIVFNHKEIRFELWLMGQNAKVQKKYWDKLKKTTWNHEKDEMPPYSVIETVIIDNLNFNDLDRLTDDIGEKSFLEIEKISKYL